MSSYGTLSSIQSLGIVYSCVAKGNVILAFSVCCQGNFSEVVPRVLAMIPNRDERMTYTSGDYMFHHVTESGVTLLCITDDDFERSKAFHFLEETKTKFFDNYGNNMNRFTPYSLNSTFGEYLSQTMDVFSNESFFNMENEDSKPIRLETITVKELVEFDDSGHLEQLELLQSEDNFSLRSTEGILDDRHRNIKVKNFLRHNLKGVSIVITLIIVLVIVVLSIIAILVIDESKGKR